ncbi:MAG: hypothetical protein ACO3LT_01495 [Ilumatobacteraceae bacterium]
MNQGRVDIDLRREAERRVRELRAIHANITYENVAEHLKREGYINPSTLTPYTKQAIKNLWLDEGALETYESAEQRAIEIKEAGATYQEVVDIMQAEGWINPRTKRPFGLYTLRQFCLGIADQRGQRQAKHGDTPEERAEYWKQYKHEYGKKYRAENRQYLRELNASYYR